MGTYETCHRCGSPEALYVEFNSETKEKHQFCSKCGYSYHYKFEESYNEQTGRIEIIRKPKQYHKNTCYLVILDTTTGEIIWKKSMKELRYLTEKFLHSWLEGTYSFKEPLPQGKRDIYTENMHRLRPIIEKGDEIGLCFNGCGILVLKTNLIEKEKFGSGVMTIHHKLSDTKEHIVMRQGMSKTEMLKHMRDYRINHMLDTISIYGTWFNEKEMKIEELKC